MTAKPWLLDWCGSAFGNKIVRSAVRGQSIVAAVFVGTQALDGNWLAVVGLATLWAMLVVVAVLAFRAGRTSGIREGDRLDELMTDPVLRRKFKEVNGEHPFDPHFHDQLLASVRETRRFASAAVAGGFYRELARVPAGDVPEWIRLGALVAFTTWAKGRGRTCMHSPTWRRPQPVFASAWAPGLVTCIRCVFMHLRRAGSVVDRTCDHCGHVVGGRATGEPIYPNGDMTWQFGVCPGCLFWTPRDG